MKKAIILIFGFILFEFAVPFVQSAWSQETMDHELFDKLLITHVDQKGFVNYDRLCQDPGLQLYTEKLSRTDPTRFKRADRLAFWINAYNAFTLQVICNNYPIESISKLHGGGLVLGTVFKTTIWDKKWFRINGEEMSLGHIEHKILRPQFEEPRIHFAIVCAAKSCPPLRREAFTGEKVSAQLADQGRTFLARKDLNRFNLSKKTAYLSGIFKWFLKDFGRNKKELLIYLADFAPTPELQRSLRAEAAQWKIKWNDYDWGLNRQ